MSDTIRIPLPSISTGPTDDPHGDAANYLVDAATRVRTERYWGSGVTALVSTVLDDAATAIVQRHRVQSNTPPPPGLLTTEEHDVMRQTAALYGAICDMTGDAGTRSADLTEVVAHIHALQHMVLAQAAARAYPDDYRLLGGTLVPS